MGLRPRTVRSQEAGSSTQRHELEMFLGPRAQAASVSKPHGWNFPCTSICSDPAVHFRSREKERTV